MAKAKVLTADQIRTALATVSYAGHSCATCEYKITTGDNRCGLKGCRITQTALDVINKLSEALDTAITCIEDCEYASLKNPNSRVDEAVKDWYEYADKNNIPELLMDWRWNSGR